MFCQRALEKGIGKKNIGNSSLFNHEPKRKAGHATARPIVDDTTNIGCCTDFFLNKNREKFQFGDPYFGGKVEVCGTIARVMTA
jgi:hypothetical protein